MYEPITLQRLDDFAEVNKEYSFLLKQKAGLERKLNSLKSIDYSKIKVTSGNAHKDSEQERYAISLEKINKKLSEYSKWLEPEGKIIKTQIARVKQWNYRKILVYRYIEKWKWAEIIQDFFDFEDDYEAEKNNKYKDTVMYWHRRALEELEKISEKPYEPLLPKQLPIQKNEEKKC